MSVAKSFVFLCPCPSSIINETINILQEPLGGAHADPSWTSQQIKAAIVESMNVSLLAALFICIMGIPSYCRLLIFIGAKKDEY